ncbi:formyltetrahydrofolate deformylase [Zobellella denitrificans]|uniref:Formyltetrahydrofolate deformylase n=1 Tax=Zobellella denitrificans TaxID=347534 RepID=A0A231MVX1_9GAMM|nr:formyltetrahydrofolate deformylase [Zobellella denitrificans]ATG73405.1 formyltetrahydrofolate deformylase [Zobellella denitrificans]OXS14327.1 formyltetrahydrofolate deformylase [Zobellella denitrificans]
MAKPRDTYYLTAHCRGSLGTVDVVTRYLREQGCYVVEMQTFDDVISEHFFIRVEFRPPREPAFDEDGFRAGFRPRAEQFGMQWELTATRHRPNVVILVSKFDHCLNDLLYRYRTGQLAIEIPAIISNHPDLQRLADWHHIPYYHLPVNDANRAEQEAQVLAIIRECEADLVVLARYMQVLSPAMCAALEGWAINIHHSLLPGFKGAKPYHQAYDKGVKLVGATAHYINNDLDEGPIITQGVEVVDHSHYPEQLIAKGRDIECITLARAVQYHIERRVFLHNGKTVVFTS